MVNKSLSSPGCTKSHNSGKHLWKIIGKMIQAGFSCYTYNQQSFSRQFQCICTIVDMQLKCIVKKLHGLNCKLKVQHCIDCQSSVTTESMNEGFSLHFSKFYTPTQQWLLLVESATKHSCKLDCFSVYFSYHKKSAPKCYKSVTQLIFLHLFKPQLLLHDDLLLLYFACWALLLFKYLLIRIANLVANFGYQFAWTVLR